jgi:hypothetical protein
MHARHSAATAKHRGKRITTTTAHAAHATHATHAATIIVIAAKSATTGTERTATAKELCKNVFRTTRLEMKLTGSAWAASTGTAGAARIEKMSKARVRLSIWWRTIGQSLMAVFVLTKQKKKKKKKKKKKFQKRKKKGKFARLT